MSKANNPQLKSWVEVKPGSDFPIQNLPFGIFKTKDSSPRVGVAIGDYILDLAAVANAGLFKSINFDTGILSQNVLNSFISLGKPVTNAVRELVSDLLNAGNRELQENAGLRMKALVKQSDAQMLMPVYVPNYTDFYSSREHATNVGTMFRDPANALIPNWLHLPVGYHGRSSSIIVSGVPVHRPKGEQQLGERQAPVFGPCKQPAFELELGFIVGKSNELGNAV